MARYDVTSVPLSDGLVLTKVSGAFYEKNDGAVAWKWNYLR